MDRKAFLRATIKVITIVAIVLAAYPFIASLAPSAKAVNDSLFMIELPKLEPGIVHTIEVNGMKLFVLKPSESQSKAIKELDPYVSDQSVNTYQEVIGAYVYWAYSSKWDCPLGHKPPQASRLRDWSKNAKWLGGYWDWWCEVSYDYSGRAINKSEYTYNGYTWPGKGLRTPTVFKESGTKYVVSAYQR